MIPILPMLNTHSDEFHGDKINPGENKKTRVELTSISNFITHHVILRVVNIAFRILRLLGESAFALRRVRSRKGLRN